MDSTTKNVVLGFTAGLVIMCITANAYTIARTVRSLLGSQRRHLQRAIARLETVKSEGFLQALRREVTLMTDMVI